MATKPVSIPARLSVLMVLLVVTFLLFSGTGSASAPSITVEHRVRAGDTLWDIASQITAPGEDVRASIDRIMQLNGLETSGLRTGQVLLVPAG